MLRRQPFSKRLRPSTTLTDARRIVHEEFVLGFEAAIAVPEEKYTDVASDLLVKGGSRRNAVRKRGFTVRTRCRPAGSRLPLLVVGGNGSGGRIAQNIHAARL